MNIDVATIGNLSNQLNSGLSQIQSIVNQTGAGGVVTTPQVAKPIAPTVAKTSPIVWIGIVVVVIAGIIISNK